MEQRVPVVLTLMLLLIVPMCTAFRIPKSFGKFGRVPAVARGENELTMVVNLQYQAQHPKSVKESGATQESGDQDVCNGLNGFQLAHCQRQRFERFLVEADYPDAKANDNAVYAPLPS